MTMYRIDRYRTAEVLADLPADTQTKSMSPNIHLLALLLLGFEVRFEDVLKVVLTDANTIVLDADF